MASKPPDAFLSYTRFDDHRGDISAFREHLQDAVREVTGQPFEIFQDVDDIEIGERWSDKLDQMLAETRFFIPILTPSYFNSEACRNELKKFLQAEERIGRLDLILPIYYIRCPVLEDKELRQADELASAIDQRQRWEWRELRHYSLTNRKVRMKIESLALEIAKARQVRVTRRAEPAARPGTVDQEERAQLRALAAAELAAEQARRDAPDVARLEAAIDLLMALDILRPHLNQEHLQEIKYVVLSRSYEKIKRYSRIVSALSAVLIGREKSASLRAFAVYTGFIAEIERYVRDPLSLEPDDADEALRLSDGFITAMEKYTVLHEDVSRMIGAVLTAWPDNLKSGHDFDLRNGMILRFEEIDATLQSDTTLGLAQIETLIEECSLLFKDLEELLHRIHDGPGPYGRTRMSVTDDALVFFDLAAGSAPSWDEIQRAYRAYMKRVHPDLAAGITDPEEIARHEELVKKANIYRDLLRRRGSAGESP